MAEVGLDSLLVKIVRQFLLTLDKVSDLVDEGKHLRVNFMEFNHEVMLAVSPLMFLNFCLCVGILPDFDFEIKFGFSAAALGKFPDDRS